MTQLQRFADGDALLAFQQSDHQVVNPHVVVLGKQQYPLLVKGVLHQLPDQQLGHLHREGDEFELLVEQFFQRNAKQGRRLFGSLFTVSQLGDGGLGVCKKAKALAPLAIVNAVQLRHQPLYCLVSRQKLAAGVGVRLTIAALAQGVKNDLVDIETHVTKP